jgi:hypothetical protein
MPALLGPDRRVVDRLFQPADYVALLDGEFVANPNGPDAMHQVYGLALPQTKEGLYVPAAEKRNGFGRAGFGEDRVKFMNIGRIVSGAA